MAKVTEQDVISYLKEKLASLTAELKKTQAALDAFTGHDSSPVGQVTEGTEEPSAKGKRGRKPTAKKPPVKPLDVPAEFDANAKLDSKIAFILSNYGPLFNTEIIERLQGLEPEKDPDKLSKAVMVKLSALHKVGKIKGEKEGRKFKYQL